MMRMLAWCATKRSTSVPVKSLRSRICSLASANFRTAYLKTCCALLLDVVQPLVDRLVARRAQAAARRHVQVAGPGAVHLVREVEDAGAVLARLEDHRPRGVAEEDAGRAVLEVEDRRHHVRADHHHLRVPAGLDELRPHGEGVDEAGAGGRDVEAPGLLRPDPVLDEAGGGREEHVRGGGGDDDEVELVRPDAAPAEGVLRRQGRDRARGGARLDDVPPLDPGAGADPLVRGVDDLLEVGVRHHPLRDVRPERGDRGPSLAHAALVLQPRRPAVVLSVGGRAY